MLSILSALSFLAAFLLLIALAFSKSPYVLGVNLEQTTQIEGYAFELYDARGRLVAAHDQGGRLHLFKGFQWDGASGPAIDTRSVMAASAAHDALYQAIGVGLLPLSYRKRADALLEEMAIECGASRFRARYFYLAVRVFGRLAIGKIRS